MSGAESACTLMQGTELVDLFGSGTPSSLQCPPTPKSQFVWILEGCCRRQKSPLYLAELYSPNLVAKPTRLFLHVHFYMVSLTVNLTGNESISQFSPLSPVDFDQPISYPHTLCLFSTPRAIEMLTVAYNLKTKIQKPRNTSLFNSKHLNLGEQQ